MAIAINNKPLAYVVADHKIFAYSRTDALQHLLLLEDRKGKYLLRGTSEITQQQLSQRVPEYPDKVPLAAFTLMQTQESIIHDLIYISQRNGKFIYFCNELSEEHASIKEFIERRLYRNQMEQVLLRLSQSSIPVLKQTQELMHQLKKMVLIKDGKFKVSCTATSIELKETLVIAGELIEAVASIKKAKPYAKQMLDILQQELGDNVKSYVKASVITELNKPAQLSPRQRAGSVLSRLSVANQERRERRATVAVGYKAPEQRH